MQDVRHCCRIIIQFVPFQKIPTLTEPALNSQITSRRCRQMDWTQWSRIVGPQISCEVERIWNEVVVAYIPALVRRDFRERIQDPRHGIPCPGEHKWSYSQLQVCAVTAALTCPMKIRPVMSIRPDALILLLLRQMDEENVMSSSLESTAANPTVIKADGRGECNELQFGEYCCKSYCYYGR
jgi:hypothetical protein